MTGCVNPTCIFFADGGAAKRTVLRRFWPGLNSPCQPI